MSKKQLCIFLVILFAASLITGGTALRAAAKTLKIGVIHSLTGFGSEVEMVMRNGEVLCRDWINEKGGITIGGEKYLIDLIVEDQKGNVDGAVAAATKLVERDKVKFIIGQMVPDMTIAASLGNRARQGVAFSGLGRWHTGCDEPQNPLHLQTCPFRG